MKRNRLVLFTLVLALVASVGGFASLIRPAAPAVTRTALSESSIASRLDEMPPRASRSRLVLPMKPSMSQTTHYPSTHLVRIFRPVRHYAATRRYVVTSPSTGSVWDRLASCESGGNWADNTGNGFYGGLQFDLQTWHSYGGSGRPDQHSRSEQIAVAERLRAARGFQPWPACSRKLGLR